MAEPNMLQKQREILRAFRQANPQRVQAEAEAEMQHKKELAEAETFLQGKKNSANALQDKTNKLVQDAKYSLSIAQLNLLFDEGRATQPPGNPESDTETELNKSVGDLEKASKAVQSSVSDLEWWREKRAERRKLLVRLAIVAIVILAIVAFFAFQAWQRNNELNTNYQNALTLLQAHKWEDARSALGKVIALDPNYKEAQTLLPETYYGAAVQALESKEWVKAEDNLNSLLAFAPTYKDAQKLLMESFYRHANALIDARDWENAKPILEKLIAINRNYKDTDALTERVYYENGLVFVQKKQKSKTLEAFLDLYKWNSASTRVNDLASKINSAFSNSESNRTPITMMLENDEEIQIESVLVKAGIRRGNTCGGLAFELTMQNPSTNSYSFDIGWSGGEKSIWVGSPPKDSCYSERKTALVLSLDPSESASYGFRDLSKPTRLSLSVVRHPVMLIWNLP